MPIDKITMAAVCRVHGHNLASLQSEILRNPKTGDVFPQFKIICTKCGGDLDEIAQDVRARRGKVSATRGRRTENTPTLSSPPPPIGSNDVEEL